ncbi:MAG TPA: hypothetical protein VLR26_08940, partial [Frankiaceae bacterium]|nr:hypothetical protein [Frankiaceae bacterium]
MSTEVSSSSPFPTPPLPDARAGRAAARLLAERGSGLGRLPGIAGWIAGVQGAATPQPFRRVRAVLVTTPPDDAGGAGGAGNADNADDTGEQDTAGVPTEVVPVLDALSSGAGVTRRLVEVASVGI